LVYDSDIGGENLSLVEFGQTGEMANLVSGYNYTIITVGGVEYIFLDDILDPTAMAINPFKAGRNPLDGDPTTGDDGVPHSVCFVNGSGILTPDGERPVEDLLIGDFVITLDSGVQKVVWTGRRLMTSAMERKHSPIRISANAFGKGLPTESFHPGDMAMAALNEETRVELLLELADMPAGGRLLSHMTLKGFEVKALIAN